MNARSISRHWLVALLAAGVQSLALAQSAVVKTDEVRAELVAHAPDGVVAGKPVWLGLSIEHAPHWHTYWRNPGDSGLPTTVGQPSACSQPSQPWTGAAPASGGTNQAPT